MQDIFSDITLWLDDETPFALATVTQTWGSSPRSIGSAMAVTRDMQVVGSVSGGCVETAVIETALEVLKTRVPQILTFGVTNETAWSVGLTCGGKISVFVEPCPAYSKNAGEQEVWQALKKTIKENEPVILLTRLSREHYGHFLVYPDGDFVGHWPRLNTAAVKQALAQYQARESAQILLEGESVFVQVFTRKDRLLIIGAAHISIPLVSFAKALGFEVIVVDPRLVFADEKRFLTAPHQIHTRWPDDVLPEISLNEDTYAVLLTHDPKIDDAALHLLLDSDVRYIGALGSGKTHARRISRLQKAGFSDKQIGRIHGPVGLDIQAKSPGEIALSIIAQIVQIKHAGDSV